MKRGIKFFSKILKFFLFFLNKKKIKELSKLRNIHRGQECYIFGDGSSLKYFDLSKFNDRPSIATNNLIFHKDFTKLNVLYYCIYEPYWFLPYFVSGFNDKKDYKRFRFISNKIQKHQKNQAKLNPSIYFFTDISNSLTFKGNNIFYLSNKIISIISDDFSNKKINYLEGSLRVQILLAVFLGFKKAYLVGHDYTHDEASSNHFYDKGKGIRHLNKTWNKDFFNFIQKQIKLTTITIKKGSKTIEAINYLDFTKGKLKYKENTQIVSKKNREILKSWPYYQID